MDDLADSDNRQAIFARLREEPLPTDIAREAGGAPAVVDGVSISYVEEVPAKTVNLRHPVILDGRRIDAVDLRHPIFEDVRRTLYGEISELELHAAMAGLPPAVLRALRWPDFDKLTKAARRIAPDLKDI